MQMCNSSDVNNLKRNLTKKMYIAIVIEEIQGEKATYTRDSEIQWARHRNL